jgi:putative endopeptidase
MKRAGRWSSVGVGVVAAVAIGGAQTRGPVGSGILTANFDRTVRPQDDFFRYVNGTWLATAEIPADKARIGAFTDLADQAEADVRTIIETAASAKTRPAGSVRQQVGDLYASFMDEARANQLGATPVHAELARIDAITTPAEVAAESGALSFIDAGGPIASGVAADAKNPATTILYTSQAGTGLPDRDDYLKTDPKFAAIRAEYATFLETLFTLAGRTNAAADARAVLALEIEIAKVQWPAEDNRDAVKTYNKMTWDQMTAEMPGFDWRAWAKPQGLDRIAALIVAQPSFFKSFAALVPATPLATWKAWLAAQYLRTEAPYLSQPFVDAEFALVGQTLNGEDAQRPRWKRGVALVNATLGEAVGRLFVQDHFPASSKRRMQVLVANLLAAYRQSITALDWMTPETKKQALAKLAKFGVKIGYPDKWRDYAGLSLKADDLVGNVERARRFENSFDVARLGRPPDRTMWLMTPQTVNAYYRALSNEIVFPAAILRPPFFNAEADDAVNYGAIGAVIGHEIGHGFDDQGRRFDGTGALHDWWTTEDATEFQTRADRLVAQFNQFRPAPGMTVNGQLTLGENIGDLGGLTVAYRAYELSLGGQIAPTIEGFTAAQRFFIGWAQIWRAKERPESLRQLLLSNPHAPSEYRANNPPSNIQAFYDAFGLKPGDKLYRDPADRVEIW